MTHKSKGEWTVIDFTPLGGNKYTVWCIPEPIKPNLNGVELFIAINEHLKHRLLTDTTELYEHADIEAWLLKFPKPVAK